jgi:hypothetical protein
MTSRERMLASLSHREPDRVPIDLGATPVTGIAASSLSRLRLALGLDRPGDRVLITEPYQMLGRVDDDLREALGIDTEGIPPLKTLFGFPNTEWRDWELFDGTPVRVPAAFNTEPEPDGDILMYPEGDRSAPPSARLPRNGFYFDTIIRQDPIDEDRLNPSDNLEEFGPISDRELEHIRRQAERIRATGRAVVTVIGGLAFGDIALVPAPWLKHPRGIRDVAEWYMSLALRPEYIRAVFERQCEIGLANLERIATVAGDLIDVAMTTGTDFGTQRGLFASVESYRDLFRPFHTEVNRWIHRNTPWKTFIHSCGAVEPLIEDFIAAGFDILNPVQLSATGMDPRHLKDAYGDRITFWGAAVDTQHTLPFGTPEEVRAEVLERLEILAPGGGFVFNAIHNVQPVTPPENLQAMYAAHREFHGTG